MVINSTLLEITWKRLRRIPASILMQLGKVFFENVFLVKELYEDICNAHRNSTVHKNFINDKETCSANNI